MIGWLQADRPHWSHLLGSSGEAVQSTSTRRTFASGSQSSCEGQQGSYESYCELLVLLEYQWDARCRSRPSQPPSTAQAPSAYSF